MVRIYIVHHEVYLFSEFLTYIFVHYILNMIDISELEVFFININNYLENPLAKECLEENLKRLKGAK